MTARPDNDARSNRDSAAGAAAPLPPAPASAGGPGSAMAPHGATPEEAATAVGTSGPGDATVPGLVARQRAAAAAAVSSDGPAPGGTAPAGDTGSRTPAAPHGTSAPRVTGAGAGPRPEPASRTGIWLIGARGSVATTVIAGCAALAAGMHAPTGMVTETAPFADCDLPQLNSFVFGGHDTASCPLPKRAEALAAAGVLPHGLPAAIHAELAAADAAVRPGGPLPGDARTDDELVEAFAADLTDFVREHGLARAVVVNVASTEPAPGPGDDRLPPSSLYAAAALRAGCPYVNFTPSTGLHHPALQEPAERSGVPYAGRDGKTGQTLLRSVLAPMFLQRALDVRAWSGTNLLGAGDGASLADPAAAAAKNAGKARVLEDNLGHLPDGDLHIDNVPALGDWKTAWDHVAFEGFLGSRMVLQTIWQGCDSALAAPLVLDLARLTAAAQAAGLSGARPELAFFFKDPDPGASPSLPDQWRALLGFAELLRERA